MSPGGEDGAGRWSRCNVVPCYTLLAASWGLQLAAVSLLIGVYLYILFNLLKHCCVSAMGRALDVFSLPTRLARCVDYRECGHDRGMEIFNWIKLIVP